MTKSISITGCGKVGTTLAYLLSKQGYKIDFLTGPNTDSIEKSSEFIGSGKVTSHNALALTSDVIIISVPDKQIDKAVQNFATETETNLNEKVFIHTSGAHSSDLLLPLRKKGAFTASMHPIQAFASYETAVNLVEGTYFCVEGDKEAVRTALQLITAIKGIPVEIETEKKALYHASAVMASNLLVALQEEAVKMMIKAGVERNMATKALQPLLAGTVKNISEYGTGKALTGPIARGDIQTVKKHLQALKNDCHVLDIYRSLSQTAAEIAFSNQTITKEEKNFFLNLLKNF